MFEFVGLASLLPVGIGLMQGGPVKEGLIYSLLDSCGISPADLGLRQFLLLTASAMFIRAMVLLLAYTIVGHLSSELEFRTSRRLMESVIRARWRDLLDLGVGAAVDAVSRQANDVGNAASLVGPLLATITLGSLLAFISLCISPSTVAVAALLIGPLLAGMRVVNSTTLKTSAAAARLFQERTRLAIEMVQYAKYIKASHFEGQFLEEFSRTLTKLRATSIKLKMLNGLVSTTPDTMIVASLCGLIAMVAESASDKSQSVPLALLLLYRSFQYLNGFHSLNQAIIQYLPSHEGLRQISERAEGAKELATWQHDITFERDIEFREVSFAYEGSHPVFEKFNFRLKKGEILILSGPSGVGKSTFADLLVGLLEPSEGQILIDGKVLDRSVLASFRQKVAYIPQEPVIFDGTIRYNLERHGVSESDAQLCRVLTMANFGDVLREKPEGLETIVGERGLKLSGGQRQRLALARAFLQDAQLIILDEATNAVDQEAERRIFERIGEFAPSVTFVIITHGDTPLQLPRATLLALERTPGNRAAE